MEANQKMNLPHELRLWRAYAQHLRRQLAGPLSVSDYLMVREHLSRTEERLERLERAVRVNR